MQRLNLDRTIVASGILAARKCVKIQVALEVSSAWVCRDSRRRAGKPGSMAGRDACRHGARAQRCGRFGSARCAWNGRGGRSDLLSLAMRCGLGPSAHAFPCSSLLGGSIARAESPEPVSPATPWVFVVTILYPALHGRNSMKILFRSQDLG